jgi:hypothetical protein
MRKFSGKSCRKNQNTQFVTKPPPPTTTTTAPGETLCRLRHDVEKYFRAGQDTDDSTVHAHCVLDN